MRKLCGALAVLFCFLNSCAANVRVPCNTEGIAPSTSHSEHSDILTVLSYNIRGLPPLVAWDCPFERIAAISPHLDQYPIVLIQEDYAYHETLVSCAHHEFIFRGNKSRFGALAFLAKSLCGDCGSGLTAFISNSWRITGHGRASFHFVCSGWFSLQHDCWATKGYQWIRLNVGGHSVYIYNTHLDAGRTPSDHDTRREQLAVIAKDIERRVAEEDALIVVGDLNEHLESFDWFLNRLSLRPSFSDDARSNPSRRIDHILYRSGKHVLLNPVEGGDANNIPNLSDHRPVFASFRIVLSN